ncbi:MAG: hypothetical protein WCC22_06670 [Terriglobales bacterium]|jgi:hypothetical protein
MTKWRIPMLGLILITAAVVVTTTWAQMSHQRLPRNPSDTPRVTTGAKGHHCSISTIKGTWAFTTNNLYSQQGTLDGNALGVFTIAADGTLQGTYDYEAVDNLYPGIDYVGTVTVNPDCTGTFSFHDVGDTVIVLQSIVIARGGQEILGMFQDPKMEVGTFRALRITKDSD